MAQTTLTLRMLNEVERLGGLSMKLKHALVIAGALAEDIDELADDPRVKAAHEAGKLKAIEEVSEALKKAGASGNVSAVKLILGRANGKPKKMSDYEQKALRKELELRVDVIASVNEAFAKQRMLLEESENDE